MSSLLPSQLSSFISTPEAKKFNNISIATKDGDVHFVSKIIMAAHSNVLYKIFTNDIDKSKTNFCLPTVRGIALVLILDWIESGELALTWTNVVDVLETAEFLDIPLVSSLCQKWLEVRMTTNNVLGIWRFARDHFLPALEKTAWHYMTSRFVEIYKEEEFSELPAEMLKVLIVSDHLSCGEEKVWEGLMVWVGDNKRDMEEVAQMMETIRFGLLEPDFYLIRVLPEIEEILRKTNQGNARPYFNQPRCPQSLLFTFGGWSGSGPVSTISVFDPAAAMWRDLTITLPYNWAYMATVVVGTDIFLCGGHMDSDEGEWATRVLMKFCPNTMEVSRLSMMREHRNYISIAVHSGYIYAIGGNNHTQRLSSVEKYDISHNQWSMVRAMNRARSDAGAATLRGNIYVVGGFDGVAPTNTAEVFCPGTGRWSMISPMRVARSGVKVVAMNSMLYVVGGSDGQHWLRSGEMYNHDTNVWTALPDLMVPRSIHSLAVVQGRLVVIGGYQGTETLSKVEVLDMSSNSWEEVEEMSTSRSAFSSGVVTYNNLVEEVREGLRWHQEDEEKMDGVECVKEDLVVNQDSFMEYGEENESDFSEIDYPDTSDNSESDISGLEYKDTSEDSDEDMFVE